MHLKNILRRLVGRQSPPSTDGHGHPGGLETGQLLSRLLPYQHEESGSYLEQDWARFDSALNRELCAALLEIYAAGKPANDRNRHEASLLHIGCGAGSLFRAVDHFTAHSIRWRFVGTDPDWRALGYVQARFPDAKLIAAKNQILQSHIQKLINWNDTNGWPEVATLVPRLVDKLKSRNYSNLAVCSAVMPDENHMSVAPALTSRGLRFVNESWSPL